MPLTFTLLISPLLFDSCFRCVEIYTGLGYIYKMWQLWSKLLTRPYIIEYLLQVGLILAREMSAMFNLLNSTRVTIAVIEGLFCVNASNTTFLQRCEENIMRILCGTFYSYLARLTNDNTCAIRSFFADRLHLRNLELSSECDLSPTTSTAISAVIDPRSACSENEACGADGIATEGYCPCNRQLQWPMTKGV